MEDKVIRYEDFVKAIATMLRIQNGYDNKDEAFLDVARAGAERLSLEIPVFTTTKSFKCMVCDKFKSGGNYCKLYNKDVGLFDSCGEE